MPHRDGGLHAAGHARDRGTLIVVPPDDLPRLRVDLPDRHRRRSRAAPAEVEGSAYVNVDFSVLLRKHRRGVGIVQNILHPYQFQCLQVDTHEVAAIVRDIKVVAVDCRARLHADPVRALSGPLALVMPFGNVVGVYAEGPGSGVVICVQVDQVEDTVLARVDQRVGVSIDQGRRVEIAEASAQGEWILVAEGVHDAAVQQVHDEDPGLAVGAVVARAHVKDRIAAGIQRARALEGEAQVQRVAGGFAGHEVEEVDLPVHAGADHLDQVVLGLRRVVHVHVLLHVPRPFHEEGLPGPAAAGPELAVVAQLARALFPHGFDDVLADVGGAVGGVVAPVVAAEGDDAGQVVVGAALPEFEIVPGDEGLVAAEAFAVDGDAFGADQFGRFGGVHAVG